MALTVATQTLVYVDFSSSSSLLILPPAVLFTRCLNRRRRIWFRGFSNFFGARGQNQERVRPRFRCVNSSV
jgi:hypothetical protein